MKDNYMQAVCKNNVTKNWEKRKEEENRLSVLVCYLGNRWELKGTNKNRYLRVKG